MGVFRQGLQLRIPMVHALVNPVSEQGGKKASTHVEREGVLQAPTGGAQIITN
jgi:hypothetical protein